MSIKDKIIEKGIENLKKNIELCTSKDDCDKKYVITGISEPVLPLKEH